jgi:hypothetical protein
MKSLLNISFALSMLFFLSCQEVIDVDLNTADPKLVVNGTITNENKPFRVELAKTLNFDEPNDFPPVTGALVIVHDDTGAADTLLEQAAGVYETPYAKPGEPGRTYTLHIEAEGRTYYATSTLPQPVALLSLGVETTGDGEARQVMLLPEFQDPAGETNYYRFVQYNDDERMPRYFLLPDTYIDGNHVFPPLFTDTMPAPGGGVTLELQAIDRGVYKYLYALQATGEHGGSVPANPDNQFGGAALGYFAAYAVDRRTVVVGE